MDNLIDSLKEREAAALEKLKRIRKRIRKIQREQKAKQALRYADVLAKVAEAGKPLPSERELAELLMKRRRPQRAKRKAV